MRPAPLPPESAARGAVSITDVQRAITAVLPLVHEHADAAERDGRLPDEVVGGLAATGLDRLLLPEEPGGLDAPVGEILGVVELLAAADGSTAWCATIGAGSNLFAGYLPRAGARRVFAGADQGSATMLAPAGTLTPHEGGFLLTGRWPFASNCLHSTWIGLGARLPGDGPGAPVRVAFGPTEDLTIEHTWDSAGLRATGSHHVAARDLPGRRGPHLHAQRRAQRRWALVADADRGDLPPAPRPGRHRPRGARRDGPPGPRGAVGPARRRRRRSGRPGRPELAGRGRPVDRVLQARICLAAQVASDVAAEATSTAHQIAGGAAAYRGNPVLRGLDDVQAAGQHLMLARLHRPALTRVLVGFDDPYPPCVV